MDQVVLNDFLTGFDNSRYPSAFLEAYEPLECLAVNQAGETLLVKHLHTGTVYVVKCYTDRSLLSHAPESDVLRGLHHAGLPAFQEEYRNEHMLCVVREYAQGVPLDELVRENTLTERQITSICVQLCEILTYLHGQTPSVIHRDIKPQNIIVGGDGRLKLIDFGISRFYDEAALTDTVSWGTQEFAPPEQYGFSQTDSRSDIFSLGVLLCWLLTGETEVGSAVGRISNRGLAGVVKKCTAFAPKERYQSAERVRRALAATNAPRQKRVFQICRTAVTLLFALSLGFAAGRYTEFGLPASGKEDSLVFIEPLIEQAVRLRLGKGDAEPITEEELLSVTELYVFGNQAAANEEMFAACSEDFSRGDGSIFRGSITSLSDVTKLRNLRRLSLVYQNISDLTPLKQLGYLEQVEMKHNPIRDVTPLSQLTALTGLFLFDTNVSDLTSLSGCVRLTSLDVGNCLITSTAALDGLDSLQTLMLDSTPLEALDHISSHPMLEQVFLSETSLSDLAPLLDLPRLQLVEVSEDMRKAAEAIQGQAEFEILYRQQSK